MLRLALLVALVLGAGPAALAQAPEAPFGTRWTAYPALNSVTALDASGDALYAATEGGVFAYTVGSGEVQRFTTVDGLAGIGATSLAYDSARDLVWVGYDDGAVDRIDLAAGTVTSLFDIRRASQYTDRGVNALRVEGDRLYAATAFGVVVFDAAGATVIDTYPRFGTLEAATPVSDVLVAPRPGGGAGLWVATEGGVAHAPLDGTNLRAPSAWTVESGAPAPATALAALGPEVYAGAADGLYARSGGAWPRVRGSGPVLSAEATAGQVLFAERFALTVYDPAGPDPRLQIAGLQNLTAVTPGPGGSVWVGDLEAGLARLPALPPADATVTPAATVVPEGPVNNLVTAIDVGPDGQVWLAHAAQNGRAGVSVLDPETGTWTRYPTGTPGVPIAQGGHVSAFVAADGTRYAGTFGQGVTALAADGAITVYDEANSTLRTAAGTSGFVVAIGLGEDAQGNLWVSNPFSDRPLHVRSPEGAWSGLPFLSGLPRTIRLERLIVDRFGQKWFTARQAQGSGGAGIAVWDTGTDPAGTADDRVRYIPFGGRNPSGEGLPNEVTNALVEDLDGRIWIGTDRGLAIVDQPGSAFGGDPALGAPRIARTADGTRFLLGDLKINGLDVDPGGSLWIASDDGAWQLTPSGDAIAGNFTAQNAPLVSNTVTAVAVDPLSGAVYLASGAGLLAYQGDARAPVASVQALDVSPNPYRPAVHTRGVLVEGLVAETTVRVLTLTGQVVAQLDARGGTVRWDGRDARTGGPAASGVYLVAATGTDGEGTGIGKIALIR